ncbi:YdbH domain-containing protein [Pontiella sp.]|uniref:intermembrane phospholipid transport protein YdbH family protein n=1 Tax=Pontiella sp. TaxID=2837462 RepID=UPI0035669B71
MKRRGKILRGMLVVAVVAAVMLLLQVGIVPGLLHRLILAGLRDAGLPEATLEVRSCSWRGADLINVCLDGERCNFIGAVAVEYSPRSLMQGRLKRVQIIGGQTLLRIREGRLEPAKLPKTKPSGGAKKAVPFDRFDWTACTAVIEWNGRHIDIPFEGSIRTGRDRMTGQLNLALQGVPLQVTVATTGSGDSFSCAVSGQTPDRSGAAAAHEFQCNIAKTAKGFTFAGQATGPGWQLNRLAGRYPAEPAGAPTALVEWELEGHAPGWIVELLADRGYDLSKVGAMQIRGQLQTVLEKPANQWLPDFQIPDLQVVMEPGRLGLRKPRVALHGVSGNIKLRGHCENGRVRLSALQDSRVAFDAAEFGAVTLEKTALDLAADDDPCVLEFGVAADRAPARLHLAATSAGTTLVSEKARLSAALKNARASLEIQPGANPVASGRIAADGVECHLGSSRLLLALDGATWKLDRDAGGLIESTLAMDRAALLLDESKELFALAGEILQPVSASYNPARHEGRIRLEWPLQPHATLYANGQLNFREKRPVGFLSVSCDGFRVEAEQSAVRQLTDATGLVVNGGFSLAGNVRLREGRLVPWITLTAADATLASVRYRAVAEGIDGAMTFTGFGPIATPGNQQFRIRRLTLGNLPLHDGLIALRLEDDPRAVLVERAEWGCLGGRVYSRAMRIDPDQPRIDARLFANGVEMKELFNLAFGEGGSGSGALYGMIPVSFSRSNPADFSIGEGFLHSTTGTGAWTLADDAHANQIQKALEQQLGNLFQQSVELDVRDRIFKGFRNFEYSMFKIDFVQQSDGLLGRVTTRGHSRNQKIPVEFEEIVLDFPGLGENLRKTMVIKTALSQGIRQVGESADP